MYLPVHTTLIKGNSKGGFGFTKNWACTSARGMNCFKHDDKALFESHYAESG